MLAVIACLKMWGDSEISKVSLSKSQTIRKNSILVEGVIAFCSDSSIPHDKITLLIQRKLYEQTTVFQLLQII
jgi:hypothetical protein